MSNLRSKLIRLAYRKPELRADILPLLRTAAAIPYTLEDEFRELFSLIYGSTFNTKTRGWNSRATLPEPETGMPSGGLARKVSYAIQDKINALRETHPEFNLPSYIVNAERYLEEPKIHKEVFSDRAIAADYELLERSQKRMGVLAQTLEVPMMKGEQVVVIKEFTKKADQNGPARVYPVGSRGTLFWAGSSKFGVSVGFRDEDNNTVFAPRQKVEIVK